MVVGASKKEAARLRREEPGRRAPAPPRSMRYDEPKPTRLRFAANRHTFQAKAALPAPPGRPTIRALIGEETGETGPPATPITADREIAAPGRRTPPCASLASQIIEAVAPEPRHDASRSGRVTFQARIAHLIRCAGSPPPTPSPEEPWR
jgi:hypothetical protein